MKIGIISGSVSEGKNGKAVAAWTYNYALSREDEEVEYELVSIRDYDLPMMGREFTQSQAEAIKSWSNKIESFDGYVFISAEYNRSIPAGFKNALDYLRSELKDKAVGYVSYGGLGGLSAIQSLRLINAEQHMASVRTMLTFSIMSDFENMSVFKPHDYHLKNAKGLFDEVISWSKALKTIR